ncbi:MAG: sensor domain-containing diguanylate cyclase [Trueperaceae bacterium]|nr:sensor domain-containing diguanylate cyclase [Trueperaceae bacterium]
MHEDARLAALRGFGVLDTPPEAAFDRITGLLADVLDVPISLLTLVDAERIWFKSVVGIAEREVDRAPGFCDTAIRMTGAYVIEDALTAPRARRNPLVTGELGVRFYAGAPLRTSDGYTIGMLAALDLRPRRLEARELRVLEQLADVAMEHLQLRREVRQAAASKEAVERAYLKLSEGFEETVQQRTAELAHQAQHDHLTGLPNRVLLEERLERALASATRHGRALAVLFVDLDGFKHVNDTFGHTAGDHLLQQVASRLLASLRSSDTLARVSGDEFVVLIPEVKRPDDARDVALALLAGLGEPFSARGHDVTLTASVGVSVFPKDGPDAAAMQRHADAAMYAAKDAGRNRVCFYRGAHEAALFEEEP